MTKIKSELLLASKNAATSDILYTFRLTLPRVILAEILTHRTFSRNTSSTRAIPTIKMIKSVFSDMFIPVYIGRAQKGMQAGAELTGWRSKAAVAVWKGLGYIAASGAYFLTKLGVAKQIAGRVVEPWSWVTQIVSATELDNFFRLRNNDMAEPHLHLLAAQMQEQVEEAVSEFANMEYLNLKYTCTEDGVPLQILDVGEWHTPLLHPWEWVSNNEAKKISAARCARTSYTLIETGKESSMEKDIELCDKLLTGQHFCYDSETEVLTNNGWKFWKDVTFQDLVVAVDANVGSAQFELPSQITAEPYKGNLYSLESPKLSLAVTPNHRMVVSNRVNKIGEWSPFRFESAEQVAGKSRRYLRTSTLRASGRRTFDNPFDIDPVVFAKFVGFFIGDGWASKDKSAVNFNLKLEKKIKFILGVGMPTVKMKSCIKVDLPGLAAWLRSTCYTEDDQKRIPDGYLFATEAEITALFDGFRNSDGSTRRRTWVYDTTSEVLADQIQAIAHVNGMSVTMNRFEHVEPQWKTKIRLNFSDIPVARVDISAPSRKGTIQENWIPYDGLVYCATVSTGALLVRRNSHVVVSGNSPFEHQAAAIADSAFIGNFKGWSQFRKELETA